MSSLSRSAILLRALVMYTGACVLVVEILATRILAPFFGSSLITLSSVLGVTLGALSLGYYVGGILADRNPSWKTLGILLTLGGVTVLFIWPLTLLALPLLTPGFSTMLSPVIGSLILFLVPCGILGMFSPYAVGLEQHFAPMHGAGRAAGNIFFWSTLGSIGGSIAAGFFLIPFFGIRMLIVIIGLSLLGAGMITVLLTKKTQSGIALVIACFLLGSGAAAVPDTTQAIYFTDGVYQRITVSDVLLEGRNVRILWQDRNASSGIRLDSDDHAFAYTRSVAAAWTGRDAPKRSLVIGAGAFVMPRAIASASEESEVDVVDIEPGLEDIAIRYFRYEKNPRVHSIIEDGRVFLRDTGSYDLIVGDAYQATHAIPVHLTTKEFFALVKDHLTENGVFIGNFIGSVDLSLHSYLPAAMRTLLTIFPHGSFYAMQSPDATGVQNVIFIGCNRERCIDPCSSALKASDDPILSTLCERELPVSDADLEKHPILSDDYAPVEWLSVRAH